MEKILLAVDAIHPSNNALEFACYLSKVTKSKVTAVFLENLLGIETPVLYPADSMEVAAERINFQLDDHSAKVKFIENNIKRFKDACINREVTVNVTRDRGIPLKELINESRFADVMILEASITFFKLFDGTPSEFVKKVLSHSECPVIIAPETFEPIGELIFTYDGSASSLFAIKQFAHFFPQFKDRKVNIVQVTGDETPQDPAKYKFNKWLQAHYSDFHFEMLQGKSDDQLFEYLFLKKNVFIVMGAYGRNVLSRFFKHSRADLIIKTVTQPIFIAHP